jgi:hypothetical protein
MGYGIRLRGGPGELQGDLQLKVLKVGFMGAVLWHRL